MYAGLGAMFVLWWVASAYWALALFAVVFGACYGAYVALLPTIVMDLYGPRSVTGIIGCLYTGCGIGTLVGPWLAGVAYDAVGSYHAPIAAGALFSFAAAACVLRSCMARDAKPSIAVSESRGVRTLHVGGEAIQSSMRLEDPYALALDYTRCMMAFLLFHPEPREALMIGLGGGSLAKFFHKHFAVKAAIVELDRASSPRRASISRCRPTARA